MQGSGSPRGALNAAAGRAATAIIPARFASSRFPGKPLIDLAGVPMIVRVAERVALCEYVSRVVIATDDKRIEDTAKMAGFEVVMTDPELPSGSDRVAAAAKMIGATGLIVNVQGDEPLIDPRDIDVLIEETLASPHGMGTLARPLLDRFDDPNVVKVVRAQDGRALYFSRAPIPYGSKAPLQHVGLYSYRFAVLEELTRLPPSALEKQERLEQLRALEHGIAIHVAMARSDAPSIAIDTPDDVPRVLAALTRSSHATR